MITDNMFETFWKTFNPSFGVEKHDAYEIWKSSAEQASKESEELKSALSLWYEWSSKESVKIDDKDYGMVTQTAAILGDSAPVSTDAEKLAIAVKALEEIQKPGNHKTAIAENALKEIQG